MPWLGEAAAQPADGEKPSPDSPVATYFAELEALGLVDVDTGTKDTLTAELADAEVLLRSGASIDAAVALYAIVESPRFEPFEDFVEYQNAEYYLAVALASAGAYETSLRYLERAMSRGPSTLYFAPAHRRAVDIALETRDYTGVLTMLEGLELDEPIPPGATGERAYLRARIAYVAGDLAASEGELTKLSRKSRLFSSALYLRGVIRARRGEFAGAADALCEIVDTPDDDKFTFVVDDRYFTIKDLARLGLGRIAHEQEEYDDAYYHYFQIPDDSDRLPEALFEAAWSMYQKRELGTSRDLVKEFVEAFPTSPLIPEARLLAGYIELADCKFDESQTEYDALVADLQPIVDEMDRIRRDPTRRARLFDRALVRWRAERADPDKRLEFKTKNITDQVLALMRLDPVFVRLHDAVTGMERAAGDAPGVVRAWSALGKRVKKTNVGAIATESSIEQEDAADANALLQDIQRLRKEVVAAREQLARGVREKTIDEDDATAEAQRLVELQVEVDALQAKVARAAEGLDAATANSASGGLGPMIRDDLDNARALETASRDLINRMGDAADQLALDAIDRLYADTRRVLDKAKLGKIDAVIGQKRKLDIEVTDLSSGRYPPELHGRLWEQGMIGDDEEFWPFEGEFWSDEYEGWR